MRQSSNGSGKGSKRLVGVLLLFLLLLVGVTSAFAADSESEGVREGLPTSADILAAIESGGSVLGPPESTEPAAAEGVPHRDLSREEALDLMKGVFGPALAAPAGMFDELEVDKFLSPTVAVVSAGEGASVGNGEDEAGEGTPGQAQIQANEIGSELSGATLLTSTVPLQADASSGAEETIDLSLEPSGADLEPANPATDVSVPMELGDGIDLPGPGVTIELAGAPASRAPTTLDGSVAFYPNVAEDTDLAVAPTATGVETLTQIRSADSPQSQSFDISIPAGADLQASANGGATVMRGDELLLGVAPPLALDAAGDKVPVSLEVAEHSLVLHVSPSGSTQYPILLDPLFQTYEWLAKSTSAGLFQTSYHEEWNPVTYSQVIPPTMSLSTQVFQTWVPLYSGQLGLNVQAGGEHKVGDQTAWNYTVPRYFTDYEKFGVRPTSYIGHVTLSNLVWQTASGYPSPILLSGIWDGVNNNFVSSYMHEGREGHSLNDMSWQYQFANSQPNKNAKVMAAGIFATESQPSGSDHLYVGTAAVELADADVPQQPIANGSSSWVNQAAPPLTFTASDTGLGVSAVTASTEQLGADGKPLHSWKASYGCTGVGGSPCPRTWKSSEAGHPSLAYDPTTLPTGLNYLNVVVEDPVGNKSTAAAAQVKVDHTAPEVSISGTATEQATLGAKQPTYTVKATATDGTTQSPQSGAAKVVIEVDGTEVAKGEEACASENCALPLEWTLESRKYAAGTHTIKVTATDAVGNTSAPVTKTIELQPDSTAPTMAVTGSITEQATLGTARPQYKLRLRASDGTLGEASAAEGGPTAAYAFDESSGTAVTDSAGGHPAAASSPSWVEGKYGKAISFDGAHTCVSVPNSVDLQLSGSFTLSAWVNSDHAQEFAPLFFKESQGFYSYSLYLGVFDTGHVEGFLANESPGWAEVASPEVLDSKAWTHVALTSDGTTLRLYIGANLVNTASARTIEESDGPLYIGCFPGSGQYFKGQIDNVRIYNRALSGPEIGAEKSQAISPPLPPATPLAAYAFNEGSGTSAKDSAAAHNASLEGGATWTEGKYGKALNFNGSSGCVSVPNSEDLQLRGPFTLSAWIRPNQKQAAPIFFKEAEGFYGYSLYFGAFEEAHLEGFIAEPGHEWSDVTSPERLATKTWAHVAMTFDGTTLRLYVNGKLVDSGPGKAALESKGPLLIGCAKNLGEYFWGAIDNVRLYSRALNPAELEADKVNAVSTTNAGPLQSGIAKTEITLDGKAVGQSTSCSGENCAAATEWTLPSSSNAGKHTVVAKATDGFGNVTTKTIEIDVQPDAAKPTIETGGALSNAPSGWVEQEGYGFKATAKDSGYGVTSLALKIDGTEVASAGASCADGGCPAAIQKTIDMAPYSGGAHTAEVAATDGAGNTSTEKWNVNVDPEGHITAEEVEETLDAADATSGDSVVAPTSEVISAEERSDGNDPSLEDVGDELESAGTPDPSAIGQEPAEGFAVALPGSSIVAVPSEPNAGSTEMVITEEAAAVAGNTQPNVDSVVRPKYNGVITFQNIRDASAPEQFSWEVDLEPGQTLKAIDPQDAEVDYPSGHAAYLIAAEPAHDAVGTSVPTSISVSGGNVVTLTVNHKSAPFVYPVIGGAGWEGGYTTQIVAGPKDEQELKEEREQIQREEQEQREREWEEEASVGSGSGDEPPGEGLEEVHNTTPYRPRLMRMDVGAPEMYDWSNRKRRSKAHAAYCAHASCDYWTSEEVGTWFWNGTPHVPGGFGWRGDTLSKCRSSDGPLFADNIIKVGWAGPNPAPYGYGEHLNLWCNFHVSWFNIGWVEDNYYNMQDHLYGDGYQKQHIHEYETFIQED